MDAQTPKGPARTTYRVLRGLLLAALLTAVTALGVGRFCFDLRYVPVLTGSMAPGMPTGSLVVLAPLHPKDIRVGEVIAFKPPAPYGEPGGAPVIHRVLTRTRTDGTTVITTKGDANPVADPWRIRLDSGTFGKAVTHVPYAGGAVTWIRSLGGFGSVAIAAGVLVLALGLRAFRRATRIQAGDATA
ncbi:signal peptidase I [Streptomyces sp. NBC_00536]|uniref:signal peptidase I n=1 Tax=Streptomyces sp. NBC_00536 TaxID=2975769 RepID=UPI002E81E8C7|nr:signal peptidase I [Streptomyces sp. NBC_00536]WUC77083.1 signal peptidase I [Streptomyces sp. NBC_00536]